MRTSSPAGQPDFRILPRRNTMRARRAPPAYLARRPTAGPVFNQERCR
jgi:hypothetical protein